MNERIREMWAKSVAKHTKMPMNWQDVADEFAVLIIQECADQCTTEGPFVAEVVWGKQFHKKILEHFGIEE